MKKVILLMVLFLIKFPCFPNIQTQEFEKLNIEKVMSDIDTIKQEMDSTFYYINETCKILKKEVKLFGWKKTIQMNSETFLPFLIFIGLYLLWLRGRRTETK